MSGGAEQLTRPVVDLDAQARVPDHVAYHDFESETIMLNLETGQYHGINASGARILESFREADDIREAAASLADCYMQPVDVVERDVQAFCAELLARGLVEIGRREPG